MGSDTNIIAASAAALADSLEYAIWKSGAELRRRDERHFTTRRRATPRRTRRPIDPSDSDREVTDATTPTADRHDRAGRHAPPRPLDGDLRLERRTAAARSSSPPATTSGRPRPRATARSTRCSGPSTAALADVLTGHPRLLALRRPRARRGPRRRGSRDGHDRAAVGRRRRPGERPLRRRGDVSTNIIAASIEAYIDAINQLLAEEHWAGATEAAGNREAGPRGGHATPARDARSSTRTRARSTRRTGSTSRARAGRRGRATRGRAAVRILTST